METTKKQTVQIGRFKSGFVIAMAISLILALIAPVAAHAVEVNDGVTEVRIPIVLVTGSDPIAGAELEFSYTDGLQYLSFEPASGIENPIANLVGGNQYVGFFSAANKYVPANERVSFGNLVFNYSGAQPQSISVTEISLHSKSGQGASTSVETRKATNTITIPVTRLVAGSSDGTNQGAGAGTSGTGGATTGTVNPAANGNGAGASGLSSAVELDAVTDASTSSSTLNPNTSNGGQLIPDAGTPLAGLLGSDSVSPPLLIGALLIAAVIAGGLLYYLFFVKKKRRQDDGQAEQDHEQDHEQDQILEAQA